VTALRNFTPPERHGQKAMLLDNHLGNHEHPTLWEKSIKNADGPAV
jgi:hypothetical protein